MVSEKLRYEHKSVKAVRGTEARSRAKWEKQGWELVDETPGALRTELQFRRPRPPIPWKPLAAMGVIALLCFAVAGVSSLFGSDQEAEEPAARAETGQTSTAPEPTTPGPSTGASRTPEPAKPTTSARATTRAKARAVTDDEVIAAFQNYIDERADADVVIAQAVTNVFFIDRVVVVTFDPAEVGMDQQAFDQINPYNNPYEPSESLADFVSEAVLSNSARDLKLRRAVDGILAVSPDGKPIGSRDMAEMARLSGLPR